MEGQAHRPARFGFVACEIDKQKGPNGKSRLALFTVIGTFDYFFQGKSITRKADK